MEKIRKPESQFLAAARPTTLKLKRKETKEESTFPWQVKDSTELKASVSQSSTNKEHTESQPAISQQADNNKADFQYGESQPTNTQWVNGLKEKPNFSGQVKESLFKDESVSKEHTESQPAISQQADNNKADFQYGESQSTEEPLLKANVVEQDRPARNKRLLPKITRRQSINNMQQIQSDDHFHYEDGNAFFQLNELTTLQILAEQDRNRKLIGNQWPIFIFMSLKAYEYDPVTKKRRNGIRRFSGGYLAKGTGLALSTCNGTVTELIQRGFIRQLDTNTVSGNLYFVEPILLCGGKDTKSQQPTAYRKSAGCNSADLKSDGEHIESQPASILKVSRLAYRKSAGIVYIVDNIDSLSQHEGFNERWKKLPERMREREKSVLDFLLKDNPNDVQAIFEELTHLEKTKKDHFGKPCTSPIGLIESSWSTIRTIRQERLKKEEQEKEAQIQKIQKDKEEEIRILEKQVQAETDALVLQKYEELTKQELENYFDRVQKKYSHFKVSKDSPATGALIKDLIREDFDLGKYEVQKLAELSLAQGSVQ